MEATPTVVLATWAAGLAAGGALVAWWRVVGKGYAWLTAGVVVLVGVVLSLVADEPAPWVATLIAVTAGVLASRHTWVVAAFVIAAILFLVTGLVDSPAIPLITGAILLGGVTSEMMLGHWFLIDPQLPRWSLNRLAMVGGGGLLLDFGYLATQDLFSGAGDDPILGWAYGALGVMTALLLLGVIFSLKEPSYTGVMAATGLSYLAVLTAFGVVVVGRMLVGT